MKQFLIFVKKECLHIWRDPRTLFILIWMPIVQIILYGFALTNEIKDSKIAIFDQSEGPRHRQNIRRNLRQQIFPRGRYLHSYRDIEATFKQGKIRLAVVFPKNFEYDLLHSNQAEIQLIADASDPNTANTLTNYITSIINDYQQSLTPDQSLPYTITTQVRMLYNPELKGAYNFVPGVMAMVLMLVCAMMTSMAIVREKEMGTMEVILVSTAQTVPDHYCQDGSLPICFCGKYRLHPAVERVRFGSGCRWQLVATDRRKHPVYHYVLVHRYSHI